METRKAPESLIRNFEMWLAENLWAFCIYERRLIFTSTEIPLWSNNKEISINVWIPVHRPFAFVTTSKGRKCCEESFCSCNDPTSSPWGGGDELFCLCLLPLPPSWMNTPKAHTYDGYQGCLGSERWLHRITESSLCIYNKQYLIIRGTNNWERDSGGGRLIQSIYI